MSASSAAKRRARSVRRRKYRLSGYTLTEMLIVLVIIGLIASLIVPQTLGQLGRAKAKTAKLELDHAAAALEMFATDTARYPTAAEGLQALVTRPSGLDSWDGPYMPAAQLKDPWGRPLLYEEPAAAGGQPRVGTYGADAKIGGDGANRDQFVG